MEPTPLGPEGPFFIPNQPVRSDIREDKDGLPLTMQFTIKDYNSGCLPVTNAQVHMWHADADGVYSGYLDRYPLEKFEIPPGGGHVPPTDASSFLRGIQPTDSNGHATFLTVFPGWYGVRTPHIHFKVFVDGKDCYTGEVYFDNDFADKFYSTVKPYCVRDADKKKHNEEDPEFTSHSGFKTIANVEGDMNTSLRASLDVVIVV